MPIVNFTLPAVLEKRVRQVTREKGFASKAEFFRFAAIYFMDVIDKPFAGEDERLHFLTKEISREVGRQYRGRKIGTAREQLAGLL